MRWTVRRTRVTALPGMTALGLLVLAGPAAGSSNSELVDAVKRQDTAAIRALLDQNVDVNVAVGDTTALHWAVRRNDADAVELLLHAGADINVTNELGVTPLSLACTSGDASMVSRLLKAGADPNVAQVTGETVLMTCAYAADVPAVQALLRAGAQPNAREQLQGQTALMWAVAGGHPDIARVLLEAGADLSARTIAIAEPVRDMTARTKRGGPVATVPHLIGGFTPLLFAARHGESQSAKLLLDAGADVNDHAADGLSALVIAAQSGQAQVSALLLDHGADPNDQAAGYGALHAAILRSEVDLVKDLLAHGADPNAVVTKGSPARRFGYQWDIDWALVGATPFFMAAKFAEPEIMRMLVAGGADPLRAVTPVEDAPERGTPVGTTPLMAASGLGWQRPDDVGSAGSNRRGRTLSRDRMFAEWDDEDRWMTTVELALSFHPDVNAANAAGETAMHGAANLGLRRVLQLLVEHGGRLDVENARGQTPEDLLSRGRPRR